MQIELLHVGSPVLTSRYLNACVFLLKSIENDKCLRSQYLRDTTMYSKFVILTILYSHKLL